MLPREEIAAIYGPRAGRSITVGNLYHDPAIEAHVDVDALLARHFAILGSTGVGKSSGVAVILREILAVRPDVRIFMLDGHNEYGRCFGELANVVNPRAAKLPFWLFNFEEIVDVVYGGRPGIDEELEILSELIPIAKSNYLQYKSSDRLSAEAEPTRARPASPSTRRCPISCRTSSRCSTSAWASSRTARARMNYHRLITRIEAIRNNPRYDFMFENANVGGDTMAELLSQLFRIDMRPASRSPSCSSPACRSRSSTPSSACLCRMAFDFGLWSDGAVPLLFVCEEAHRYASVDQSIGFGPTRRALSRIAKEGRKYGVYLGLVSQRPSELDPSIISQCATLFAMRMANERDQALLRSAVSDTAADLLAFIPSLATREVIGFGEGRAVPGAHALQDAAAEALAATQRHALGDSTTLVTASRTLGPTFVQEVVDRWRRAATGRKPRGRGAATPVPPAPSYGRAAPEADLAAAPAPASTRRGTSCSGADYGDAARDGGRLRGTRVASPHHGRARSRVVDDAADRRSRSSAAASGSPPLRQRRRARASADRATGSPPTARRAPARAFDGRRAHTGSRSTGAATTSLTTVHDRAPRPSRTELARRAFFDELTGLPKTRPVRADGERDDRRRRARRSRCPSSTSTISNTSTTITATASATSS